MSRACWCAQSAPTCPIHVLGRLVAGLPKQRNIFDGISADDVKITLRDRMKKLGQSRSHEFNTHDFRRGHARDLANAKGSTLQSIMKMGEWASSALLKHLDVQDMSIYVL